MYDPSGFHDDLIDRCIQAQCQYIVCGAPVGSIQLQRQNVNSKVDSSIALQLDDLRHIFLTPNGVLKKDTQTIYQIIRPCVPSQLTFLLRTCEPDATEEAVCSLHKLIDEFLILLFDSRQYVINMDNAQKLLFLKTIHLHLSKSVFGIAPSEAITGAAFIWSFTLSLTVCAPSSGFGKQETQGSIHCSHVIFRAPRIFALSYNKSRLILWRNNSIIAFKDWLAMRCRHKLNKRLPRGWCMESDSQFSSQRTQSPLLWYFEGSYRKCKS